MTKRTQTALLTNGREVDVHSVRKTESGVVLGVLTFDARFYAIVNVAQLAWR
jgi:hypothetical protein